MKNAFTIDLEDWFCSHNLKGAINYQDWDALPGRMYESTYPILELLQRHNTKATFFVLGWVASRYPDLVKTIAAAGHEIASHGYAHQLLTSLTRQEFEADLQQSVTAIQAACGIKPAGYRAPAFTVVHKTMWALDVLKANGFTYDSSIYPTGVHPDYGVAEAPLDIFITRNGLTEIPLSCAQLLGRNIPCSGGAYLRFFPYVLYKRLVNNVVNSGRSYIFYIHPWEVDTAMPKVKLPLLKGLRHYTNISQTMGKMENLLRDFEFTTLGNVIEERSTIPVFSSI